MNLDPNDGWQCCSLHDPAKRRGIWWRMTECGLLEIVAGREGDDATALVPPPHAELVAKCLACGTMAMELAEVSDGR